MEKIKSTTTLALLLLVLDLLSLFVLKNYFLSALFTVLLVGYWVYISKPFRITQKANVLFKAEQYEEAFALFDQAIALKTCPKLTQIMYAYKKLTRGDLEGALALLSALDSSKLSKEERLNYDAISALATWKQGDLEGAILVFEKLLDEKQSLFGHEILGMLLNIKGDNEKAITFNEKAFELFPSSDIIKDNLATSYYHSEYDYLDEVKKLCKELITNEVGFPEPYYTYALLMEEVGKLKAARKYLKLALEKEIFYLSDIDSEDLLDKLDEIEAKIEAKTKSETTLEQDCEDEKKG